MEIAVRALTDRDKEAALWVEQGAMPDNKYLGDVWQLFTIGSEGDLLGAFSGGCLAGIGKITRLFGDYGWLETLRVHPAWQRKGLGRAIWEGFFREIERMKLKSVGMYTEAENKISKGLAEQFGLSVRGFFREFRLPLNGKAPAEDVLFEPVPAAEGEALLCGLYDEMPPYLVVNRTFYPAAEGLGRHLAEASWLYRSREGGLVVAGNLFHAQRLLHVPYFSGRAGQALAFAAKLAAACGAPALSCLCPIISEPAGDGADIHRKLEGRGSNGGGPAIIEPMQNYGFTPGNAFMTLWREL